MQKRNVKDFPLSNVDFLDLRNGAKNNFEDFAAVNTFRATLPVWTVRLSESQWLQCRQLLSIDGGAIVAGRDFEDLMDAAAHSSNRSRMQRPRSQRCQLPRWRFSASIFPTAFWGRSIIIGKSLPVSATFGPAPIIVGCARPGF
jgi:hypothetical protein